MMSSECADENSMRNLELPLVIRNYKLCKVMQLLLRKHVNSQTEISGENETANFETRIFLFQGQ